MRSNLSNLKCLKRQNQCLGPKTPVTKTGVVQYIGFNLLSCNLSSFKLNKNLDPHACVSTNCNSDEFCAIDWHTVSKGTMHFSTLSIKNRPIKEWSVSSVSRSWTRRIRRSCRSEWHRVQQAVCGKAGIGRGPQHLHLLPNLRRWRQPAALPKGTFCYSVLRLPVKHLVLCFVDWQSKQRLLARVASEKNRQFYLWGLYAHRRHWCESKLFLLLGVVACLHGLQLVYRRICIC